MPRTATGQRYGTALEELWTALAHTLRRLDGLAAEPAALEHADAGAHLRRLQYSLHTASEAAYGIDPPAGAESSHLELAAALEAARDITGDVAETLDDDGHAEAARLLHEWRGALFRVRLARMRLATPSPETAPPAEPAASELARPLAAVLLALAGALAFAGGAVLDLWPVWTAGIGAVTASVLVYRP